MDARRARGGALYRASRVVILVVVLLGVVLLTPAPGAPPDVMSLVDQMKGAFEPVRLGVLHDVKRLMISGEQETPCDCKGTSMRFAGGKRTVRQNQYRKEVSTNAPPV